MDCCIIGYVTERENIHPFMPFFFFSFPMLESNRQGTLFSFRAVEKGLGVCHTSLMEVFSMELAGRSWLQFREGPSLAETP